MSGRSEFADADGLIDASVFPCRSQDLDVERLEDQVVFCRQTAVVVVRAADDAHHAWVGTGAHYQAPEAGQLYRTMGPVRSEGERERAVLFAAPEEPTTCT
ncbi:hypothetical protein [Myceligenerans indicum]|uniref:Uncharacterized protein n=1 Tax=Myceligenerans indicum TaxID=2593663 RepID=A0ABS1LES5_9MICO|nr:hypothetical protein [Myceligenerans indicum]MBL0884767.1 hypothetical protein [Myceligenerans indicum]